MDVETTSAAECTIKGFDGNELEAQATSGSKIVISDIKATEVEAQATSGAHIKLSGECGKLSTGSSSGGKVDSGKLYYGRNKKSSQSSTGKSDMPLPRNIP